MAKKSPLFDVVKGFAMFFVISGGHLINANIIEPCPAGGGLPELNFKVAINMPIFFMISGYFAKTALEAGDTNKVLTRIIGYFWPVMSFGLALCCCMAILGVKLEYGILFPVYLIKRLWFIRTLGITYLIVFAIWKCCGSKHGRLGMLLLVYLFLIINPGRLGMWYLRDVMHMLPYFVFGLLVLRYHEAFYKDWRIAIPCGIFYVVVCLFMGDVRTNGMGFYWVSSYYKDMLLTQQGLICFLGRTILGITGSLFLLYLFDLGLRYIPMLGHMSALGTTTLGVYVFHETILGMMGRCWPFPLPYNCRWLVAISLFLLFHTLVLLLKHYKVTRVLFFGDSVYIENTLNRINIKSV